MAVAAAPSPPPPLKNDRPVRIEPKRLYYSVNDDEDFDPRICVRAHGCAYGHRRSGMRRCCRGWWSVSRLHPFYMLFWVPKSTAFTLSRRLISFLQIILASIIRACVHSHAHTVSLFHARAYSGCVF
jgi:hypothetical protein